MVLSDYLEKHAFLPQKIFSSVSDKLGIIVVIPVFNEPNLIPSLASLNACIATRCSVEVILVFNASEKTPKQIVDQNIHSKQKVEQWYNEQLSPRFKLYILEEYKLPHKHAGVGLARKIGMDEAIRRFATHDILEGVIVCFDADSLCDPNYLCAIEDHFKKNTDSAACSIHFEHPVEGDEHDEAIYNGIAYYELHLRYYKNGLKYAQLPFAFHTIGSSMVVRAIDYCKQGGMNRRKAGEDFYFLQKFINLGRLTELNTTKVIPSPRPSDRVPFGTGRSIGEMLKGERDIKKSYSFETFETLKECFVQLDSWYINEPQFHEKLIEFVGKEELIKKVNEIRQQSTSKSKFRKRFFLWFDAFMTLKFTHFLRDHHYPLEPLENSVPKLLNSALPQPNKQSIKEVLKVMREIDKGGTA